MKALVTCIIFCLLGINSLFAQSYFRTADVNAAALGGIGSNQQNACLVWQNPALLVQTENLLAYLGHSRPYYQENYSVSSFCLQGKILNQYLGFGLNQSGNSFFKQTLLSAGKGIRIHKNLCLGMSLNMLHTFQFQINGQYNFFGNLGMHYQLNEETGLYASIQNLNATVLETKWAIALPVDMRLGLYKQIFSGMKILGQVGLESEKPLLVALGSQYQCTKNISVSVGWRSNNEPVCLGLKVNCGGLQVEMAQSWHSTLGFSGSLGLYFRRPLK